MIVTWLKKGIPLHTCDQKCKAKIHLVHQKLVTNSGMGQWLFAIVRKSYFTLTTQMRGLRRYQVVGGAKESK